MSENTVAGNPLQVFSAEACSKYGNPDKKGVVRSEIAGRTKDIKWKTKTEQS